MKFRLWALRYRLRLRRSWRIYEGGESNFLRGRFGASLRRSDPQAYQRLFAPRGDDGPSGFADRPRPFAFREPRFQEREAEFGFHLFDTREPWVEKLNTVFEEMLYAEIVSVEGAAGPRELSLEPNGRARETTVRFVTPTELKSGGEIVSRPEFGVLAARARDRVSALSALYGEGPLALDYRAFGERASRVTMTRCDLHHVDARRHSRATGQVHPLGGFVGEVEYAGDLGEFLPFLRAAEWTGVGRQTAWGKGVIQVHARA